MFLYYRSQDIPTRRRFNQKERLAVPVKVSGLASASNWALSCHDFCQEVSVTYHEYFQNDSRYKVAIETIRILRGDTDHESPLTEAVKPRNTGNWRFESGEGRTIFWGPQYDPISMLKSLVQGPDPNFPNGKVIAVAIELVLRVEGQRLSKKFVRQVLMQGNQILTWGA